MRANAALYDLPPQRVPGQRGRPRQKGERLPALPEMARQVQKWRRAVLDIRGQATEALVWSRPLLWYQVCGSQPILLVIVRDPRGKQPDDYFFTTDLEASAEWVASFYSGRWSIEVTFRDVKQDLAGEDPQSWRRKGPERAAALSFWLYGAIWLVYIQIQGVKPSWKPLPWYPGKRTPSFADALATLRGALWRDRIYRTCASRSQLPKITDQLIEILARAS